MSETATASREAEKGLVARLIETHDEYRRLHAEHIDLEQKLGVFAGRTVLSDAEQVEEARLKKVKLAGRDRMEAIVRAARA
jgi:hypothetical protein